MRDEVRDFRDLIVWQKSMDLAVMIYELCRQMPRGERSGMVSQLQRAAASVPANIAEGHKRSSRKDYARFIAIARGSLAETETFLILAARVGNLPEEAIEAPLRIADEISRMLNALRLKLGA